MKLTITKTYTARKTTFGAVVKSGDYTGLFVTKGDLEPLWLYENREWIAAQSPRKIIYLLEEERIDEVLK